MLVVEARVPMMRDSVDLCSKRGQIVNLRPAVHRTIFVVDVEKFGDHRRTNPRQVATRAGLYRVLEQAFNHVSIPWTRCHREDRGDGVLILAPADVPKGLFVDVLPLFIVSGLHQHNASHPTNEQIRLRMAVHAGEVNFDDHGVTSASVNLTFRLLDALPFKAALAKSSGVLALIVSVWFYEEVVRHSPVIDPSTYRHVKIALKETVTVGWISLPDHPYLPLEAPPTQAGLVRPKPRQLPAHTPHFVGRVNEMGEITAQLATSGRPVVISAINGIAGVGKTALAIQWAHKVASQFQDGHLYVNLRGFHSTGAPMHPTEVIRGFLDAFEVPHEQIPNGLEAQTALYRSVLADRHVLIVLDNARDAEQVRPLLPGAPTCMVIVTSRDRLIDLVTREGAHPINLDAFNLADAETLLARRLGSKRIAAEPHAVRRLIDYCAGLPLALSIVAARIQLNPNLTLRMLVDELADERTRLHVLGNLRAVFSWSYQHLDPTFAAFFRLLGLHPGSELSLAAAASLGGLPIEQARKMLAELTQAHLLTEPLPGRFTFHDLLHVYVSEQCQEIETDDDRHTAALRLLDHYFHTAFAATDRIVPQQELPVGPEGPPQAGVTVSLVQDSQQAMKWFASERTALLTMVRHAYETGFDAYAWKLALTLVTFLDRSGRLHDLIKIEYIILASVRRLDDCFAQGRVHLLIAWVHARLGRCSEALEHAERATGLCQWGDDRAGVAVAHYIRAIVYGRQTRLVEAVLHAQYALNLFPSSNNLPWHARTYGIFSWIYARCGDFVKAVEYGEQTLSLLGSINDHADKANTLDNLGRAHYSLGNYEKAVAYYSRSVALNREYGDHYHEAMVLRRLGDAHSDMGDRSAALTTWRQALRILESLGVPGTDQIRTRLGDRINEV
jgi:tetratricopeptide (TPR) repeat protein